MQTLANIKKTVLFWPWSALACQCSWAFLKTNLKMYFSTDTYRFCSVTIFAWV